MFQLTTRNIRAIDRQVLKADVAASITALDCPTANQLNDQLHALLDRHTPATQRRCPGDDRLLGTLLSLRSNAPWSKRNDVLRGGAWLRSRLTVHKQIFNAVKHKITRLVDNAKTSFYSSKIILSTTCIFLKFSVTNRLMNKANRIQQPSLVSTDNLPQMFSSFFFFFFWKSRLHTTQYWQLRQQCPHWYGWSTFSGDPLTQFSAVRDSWNRWHLNLVTWTRSLHPFCSIVLLT